MSSIVKITLDETIELKHGLLQMKGAIKNARRLDSALGRDSTDLNDLEETRQALTPDIESAAMEEGSAAGFKLKRDHLSAARIAARLRHRKVSRHIKGAEQLALEHTEASTHLTAIEVLGRKRGVQLDIIDHGDAEDDDTEGDEE